MRQSRCVTRQAKRTMALVAVFFALSGGAANASRPIVRTLRGCVVGGKFYSVRLYAEQDQGKPGYAAHKIELGDMRLSSFEGRTVRITGSLSPGDFFTPKGPPKVLSATCTGAFKRAIRRIEILEYRVRATDAARKGAFETALELVNHALTLDPSDCDSYVDRAYIFALRGDDSAAAENLGILKAGKCARPDGANYLLLNDVAKAFEKRGNHEMALSVYRMALHSCAHFYRPEDRSYCKEYQENIRRVSAPGRSGGPQ